MAARARYAFRQRVVLFLLILAAGTAVAAVFTLPQFWWVARRVRCRRWSAIWPTCAARCGWRRRSAAAGPHASPRPSGPRPPRPTSPRRRPAPPNGRPPNATPSSPSADPTSADEQRGRGTGKGQRGRQTHRDPGERPEGDTRPSACGRASSDPERRAGGRASGPATAEAHADTPGPDRHDAGRGDGGRPGPARAGERHPARLPACVRAVSGC